jgi:mannose-6-phosphate isomerase-like protein (cupin superfamily)
MYFNIDIEKATIENEDYRRVLFTPGFQQLVLMSIPAGEDIELEVHPFVDQFFRIEAGVGEIRFGKDETEKIFIKDGSGVIVTHGTYHRIINTGNMPLKLYTIYSPPNHPKDRVDHTNPDKNKEKTKEILMKIIQHL